MKTEVAIIIFTAITKLTQSEFFDSSDVICSQKLKISRELFDTWFDSTTLEITNVNDKLINDYMVCWMQERKITNTDGEINYDNFNEWVREDAYTYFGNDITTHPLEEREEIVAKIVSECQAEVGFDKLINNKEVDAYNCIVTKIGKV